MKETGYLFKEKLNLFFGYFFQYILSIAFSVIIIPKLANNLGFSTFGQIGSLLSICGILIVFINYSFNITSVPKIATEKVKDNLIELINHVLISRLFLSIFCIIFLFLIGFFGFIDFSFQTYLLLIIFLVSNALNSSFCLIGLSKFNLIIIGNIICSILSIFFYFLLHNFDHFNSLYSVLFIILLPQLLFNFYTLIIIFFIIEINFKFTCKKVLKLLISDFSIFLSQFTSSIYIMAGPLILIALSNNEEAGIYSIIDRINNLVSAGLTMIFSLFIPTLALMFENQFLKYKLLIKKILVIYFFLLLAVLLVFFLGKNTFLLHLFSSVSIKFSIIIYLSIVYISLASLGPIITNHLVLSGKKKYILILTLVILIVTIFTSIFLTKIFGATGWLISQIFGQLIILIYFSLIFTNKKHDKKNYF